MELLRQVVQFYYWKAHELKAARKCSSSAKFPQPPLLEKTSYFHLVLTGDLKLAEEVLGCVSYDDNPNSFNWDDFALAIAKWKVYIGKLHEHLVVSLPQWINHQIIYLAEPSEVEKHNDWAKWNYSKLTYLCQYCKVPFPQFDHFIQFLNLFSGISMSRFLSFVSHAAQNLWFCWLNVSFYLVTRRTNYCITVASCYYFFDHVTEF